MKLIYRMSLSFGLLLICILGITAALIYPLMFNTLVTSQRQEMRSQGQLLTQYFTPRLSAALPGVRQIPAHEASQTQNVVITTPAQQVVFSTQPRSQTPIWMDWFQLQQVTDRYWQTAGERYIVEAVRADDFSVPGTNAVTAILSTPVSKIQSLQMELFKRMMMILSIGGLMTFLLCMLITRRLVNPLAKLRTELKKVESQRFSDVQMVKSGGEVGEVAKSIYQLANVLEKYQRTQKQFFQNASHELKTPLMSIQGYAEGIKDGVFKGERAEKGLSVIVNECERLKKVVTEMVLLAKLESEEGIFHMTDVPVEDLISQTVERMNPLLMNKEIKMEVVSGSGGPPSSIHVDREKVLQALINITGNATRYAKERIWIRTSVHNKNIEIEVSDDGEGIPENLLPHLFQRFAKGKNGETGLGLAISHAIVERCGGRITAANRPEGGAVFTLRFPVR